MVAARLACFPANIVQTNTSQLWVRAATTHWKARDAAQRYRPNAPFAARLQHLLPNARQMADLLCGTDQTKQQRHALT